jgi:hypothetical protein
LSVLDTGSLLVDLPTVDLEAGGGGGSKGGDHLAWTKEESAARELLTILIDSFVRSRSERGAHIGLKVATVLARAEGREGALSEGVKEGRPRRSAKDARRANVGVRGSVRASRMVSGVTSVELTPAEEKGMGCEREARWASRSSKKARPDALAKVKGSRDFSLAFKYHDSSRHGIVISPPTSPFPS